MPIHYDDDINELTAILVDSFDSGSLKTFARTVGGGLVKDIVWQQSTNDLAAELVEKVVARNQLGARFFDKLLQARPEKHQQVRSVAARLSVALGPWYEGGVDWSSANFVYLRQTLVQSMPHEAADIGHLAGVEVPTNLGQLTAFQAWESVINAASKATKLADLIRTAAATLRHSNSAAAKRLADLVGDGPSALPAPAVRVFSAVPVEWHYDPDTLQVAFSPTETMFDVVFLERGAQVAKSVVLVTPSFADGLEGRGTGFLIGPQRVLTNHHVLFNWREGKARADWVEVKFNYELALDGTHSPEVTRKGVITTIAGEEGDDWAIIDLDRPAPDGHTPLPLVAPGRNVKRGDLLSIIQHPLGREKKVAFKHNTLAFENDRVLQYLTDTEVGSSGSPVFNRYWEIVALHHAGGQVKVPNEHRKAWRNEGIRIERVISGLAKLAGRTAR